MYTDATFTIGNYPLVGWMFWYLNSKLNVIQNLVNVKIDKHVIN